MDAEQTAEDLLILDSDVDKYNIREQEPQIENDQFDQTIADYFDNDDEPQMEHLEILRSKFHHASFRCKQWDIIRTIREKRDVCAVMATGYGKSLW